MQALVPHSQWHKDRIRLAHTRRMLLPHAQHRNDDVQCTYKLQRRCIHHHAKVSNKNKSKSNSAREASIKASVCVSIIIKVKSESNAIQPRRPATRASLSRCQSRPNRNHRQNRIEFDAAGRPATPALSSWCPPRSMCSLVFRLAFQRCRVPAVAFVRQRDHADAGAGAKRTAIT